jgi:hypothetical protein
MTRVALALEEAAKEIERHTKNSGDWIGVTHNDVAHACDRSVRAATPKTVIIDCGDFPKGQKRK